MMARNVRLLFAVGLVVSVALLVGCGNADLGKARRYQKEGNYDQAIRHFRLVIEKDPENRSARYGLVESIAQRLLQTPKDQMSTAMIEKAMEELKPVAEPLMEDANVKRYILLIYRQLAQRYAEQGMDDRSAETWAEVIKIDPTMYEAHYNLGVAYSKLGRNEDALECFRKSIDINPYFLKGYFAIGNSLVTQERYEEAAQNYQKALEINPDDPEVRHNLGVVYSYLDQPEKAIEQLEKAIELQPGYFLAYRSLSTIYKGMGNTEKVAEIDKRWQEYAKQHVEEQEQAEEPGAQQTSE
jgi:tetratricopeptide (TPR) repeat protein